MHTLTSNVVDERLALDRVQLGSATLPSRVLGIICLVAAFVSVGCGFTEGWTAFFRSYVANFAFVTSLALGALFFVLVQHVTGASWSVVVRRIAEAFTTTLPWMAVLLGLPILIPVWTGMKEVYPWANATEVEHDQLLQWKQPYLNPLFFTIRGGVYFAIWSIIAGYFRW